MLRIMYHTLPVGMLLVLNLVGEAVGEPPFATPRDIIPEVVPDEVRAINLNCGFWPVIYNRMSHTVQYGLTRYRHDSKTTFTDDAIVFPIDPVVQIAIAPVLPLAYIGADVTAMRLTMRVEWDSLRFSVFLQQNLDDRESAPVVISHDTCTLGR